MIFPVHFLMQLAKHLVKEKLHRNNRIPLVLMLEPTFQCNLTCQDCGRLKEHERVGYKMLSVVECVSAVKQAGTPSVCITGGEPLLHPHIEEIVRSILNLNVYTHCATNGTMLCGSLHKFTPDNHFCFVIHLDGLERVHDFHTGTPGVYKRALQGIHAAKKAGFKVKVNTTIYKGTTKEEVLELFSRLVQERIDGIMVAPAFNYHNDNSGMSNAEISDLFKTIYEHRRRFPLCNTPAYFDFLIGKRTLHCAPWSTPTRDPRGWKSPCYVLGDNYYDSYSEMVRKTPWCHYGARIDKRCRNCKMHSGYEGNIANSITRPSDLFRLAQWALQPAPGNGLQS